VQKLEVACAELKALHPSKVGVLSDAVFDNNVAS
jgi:hypothetical protein